MAQPSLVRSLAGGAIAAGAAVLIWFNRQTAQEQERIEQEARRVGQQLLDQARKGMPPGEPPFSTIG